MQTHDEINCQMTITLLNKYVYTKEMWLVLLDHAPDNALEIIT